MGKKRKPPAEPAVLTKPFIDESGEKPQVLDWTPEQYHADRTRLTRGMLADFLKSPALFRGRWIDNTIPPVEPTDAMRLGSVFHDMIRGDARYVVWDRGRRAGKDWERFSQDAAEGDLTVLTRSQSDSLRGMVDAIRADKVVGPFLQDPHVKHEHVIAWTDEVASLRCKAMIDACVVGDGGGVVLDWKTTTDPSPDAWVPASRRMGGHLQVAHYSEGLWQLYGHCRWIYVVVGTAPPHDVWLLEPDEGVLAAGDALVSKAQAGIRELLDAPAGTPWRHPNAGKIVTYSYPTWFVSEYQDEEY